jgi:hypothetical protein
LNLFANAIEDTTIAVIFTLHQLDITSGNGVVIRAKSLVSKEVTIGSNSQFVALKEAIQLFDTTARRILLQLGKELDQRQSVETRVSELKDAVNAKGMDSRASEENSTILNLDVVKLVEILLDSLLRVHVTKNGIPVLIAVCLNGLTEHRILTTHNIAGIVCDDREGATMLIRERKNSGLHVD